MSHASSSTRRLRYIAKPAATKNGSTNRDGDRVAGEAGRARATSRLESSIARPGAARRPASNHASSDSSRTSGTSRPSRTRPASAAPRRVAAPRMRSTRCAEPCRAGLRAGSTGCTKERHGERRRIVSAPSRPYQAPRGAPRHRSAKRRPLAEHARERGRTGSSDRATA